MNRLFSVAEFGGGHARFAAEITAEGGLLTETQHVGDGLHREVAPNMHQHLRLDHDLVANPIGSGVPCLLFDNGAEMLGGQTGLFGIETCIAVLAEMLLELGEETRADPLVGVCLVQLALAVVAEHSQQELQQAFH